MHLFVDLFVLGCALFRSAARRGRRAGPGALAGAAEAFFIVPRSTARPFRVRRAAEVELAVQEEEFEEFKNIEKLEELGINKGIVRGGERGGERGHDGAGCGERRLVFPMRGERCVTCAPGLRKKGGGERMRSTCGVDADSWIARWFPTADDQIGGS